SAADDALAEELGVHGLEAFVDRWQALPLFASQSRLPEEVLRIQRQLRLGHDPEALSRVLRATSPGRMPDYGPALGELPIPVHLIAGDLDTAYRERARAVAGRLARGRLTVLADCGHNPLLEAPEALACALEEAPP
ncbi:MAG: alpha/beta fold hydrolase, partial [Holophagales bacterium]|nr:alpha/beta fold hydrolase [Holophagales bacterium]